MASDDKPAETIPPALSRGGHGGGEQCPFERRGRAFEGHAGDQDGQPSRVEVGEVLVQPFSAVEGVELPGYAGVEGFREGQGPCRGFILAPKATTRASYPSDRPSVCTVRATSIDCTSAVIIAVHIRRTRLLWVPAMRARARSDWRRPPNRTLKWSTPGMLRRNQVFG
jgi:hypothetical protein